MADDDSGDLLKKALLKTVAEDDVLAATAAAAAAEKVQSSSSTSGDATPPKTQPVSILRNSSRIIESKLQEPTTLAEFLRENMISESHVQFAIDSDEQSKLNNNGTPPPEQQQQKSSSISNSLQDTRRSSLEIMMAKNATPSFITGDDGEEPSAVADDQEMAILNLVDDCHAAAEAAEASEHDHHHHQHRGQATTMDSRPSIIVTDSQTEEKLTILHQPSSTASTNGDNNSHCNINAILNSNFQPLDPAIEPVWRRLARECAVFGLFCGCLLFSIPATVLAFKKPHPQATLERRLQAYRRSFFLSASGVIIFVFVITVLAMRNQQSMETEQPLQKEPAAI